MLVVARVGVGLVDDAVAARFTGWPDNDALRCIFSDLALLVENTLQQCKALQIRRGAHLLDQLVGERAEQHLLQTEFDDAVAVVSQGPLAVSGIRKVQRVARALAPESCSAPVRSVF